MDSLHARIESDGPLEALDAVGWAIRLCKRIEELHRLGVAHGGVSAHCVLIAEPSCESLGVLADARAAAERPPYHCPERLAGAGISTRDDTWAAAVTAYFALTGSMPFGGGTTAEVRTRIVAAGASPLAVFDAGDDALQGVFDSFLERDPTRREARLPDLRKAFEEWRGGELLPPLEDDEDDSYVEDDEDDDEEENIATVMRDFGDIRRQLAALQKASPSKAPPDPAPKPPKMAAGGRSSAPPSPGRATAPPKPPPPRPGGPPPRPGSPGTRLGAPPPKPAGAAPPRDHSPLPQLPSAIADEEDEEGATMLMDTEATEVQTAIEEARARKLGEACPAAEGSVSPGGALAEPAGEVAEVEEPPQGRALAPLFDTESVDNEPQERSAAPNFGSPGFGSPAGPPAGAGEAPGLPPGHGGGTFGAAPPPGTPRPFTPQDGPGEGVPGTALGGATPPQPPSTGLRTALYVSTGLLVLVLFWIALLLLERYGVIVLPF